MISVERVIAKCEDRDRELADRKRGRRDDGREVLSCGVDCGMFNEDRERVSVTRRSSRALA